MIQSSGRTVGITLSGGIDSVVLAYWFCKNYKSLEYLSPTPQAKEFKPKVRLIFANIGEQANAKITEELFWYHFGRLCNLYPELKFKSDILRIPLPKWCTEGNPIHKVGSKPKPEDYREDVRNHEDLGPNVYIDGRNAMVFSWLLSWCSYKNIDLLLTGHQSEVQEWDHIDNYRERVCDNSCLLIDRLNLMNEIGHRHRTRIQAPLLDMRWSKYHIVKAGLELGIDLAKKTYSCLFYPPCGMCGGCVIRKKAFAIHTIKDVE